jgi:uroporphyrin-III C-methyltransferase / precorrin-2 dehydrogenase / sirohydrochlorin ferrochelatase
MRYYPVFLDLAGQRCVVLGGGRFAIEKVDGLLEAGATVRVITTQPAPRLAELSAAGRIELTHRDYVPGDLGSARLVVDATGDESINVLSWAEAEAAGVLINVVDRPEQCRFIAPAIVRRDPLLIAISTSGESPFLASALRARLERWFGHEWAPFTALVGRVRRRLREQHVAIEDQTRVYRRLLNSDVRSLLRAGRDGDAQQLALVIEQSHSARVQGRVALVGAGPGDPELLTAKALDLLAAADYVLHGALIAPETLALCGPDARLEDVGKRAGHDNPRQEHINARLIELAREGHAVARLKGGDPFVFGRGGEELAALVEAGVDVVICPGVSAALAAPAAAGIPLTMRGVSSSLAITTAQGADGIERLVGLARSADTLVVLMARASLAEIAAALIPAVGAARPAAVVAGATLPGQRSVTARLDGIARAADEAGVETPATLVVGEVVNAIPANSLVNSLVEATAGFKFG